MENKYGNSKYNNQQILSIQLTPEYKKKIAMLKTMNIFINYLFIDILVITRGEETELSVKIDGWVLDYIKEDGTFEETVMDSILCDLQNIAGFYISKY